MINNLEPKTVEALSESEISGNVKVKGIGAYFALLYWLGGLALISIVLNFTKDMIHEFHSPETVIEQKTTVAPASIDGLKSVDAVVKTNTLGPIERIVNQHGIKVIGPPP